MYGANNPAPSRPASVAAAPSGPTGGFLSNLGHIAAAVGNVAAHAPTPGPAYQAAVNHLASYYAPTAAKGAATAQQQLPTTASQNSPVSQQMQAVIARLLMAHLLPQGAKMPQILLGQGAGADHTLDYMTPGTVHISPFSERILSQPGGPADYMSNYERQGLVHELGHTMQNQATMSSVPMREGGAQAWADKVAPTALQHWSPWGDGNYSGYVNQMNGRETPNWIMHGQFQPGAPLPTINAPTTPAGAYALQHVMAGIAQAAANTGILGPRTTG